MPGQSKLALIFDIENMQEQYARCLDFILQIEQEQPQQLERLQEHLSAGQRVSAGDVIYTDALDDPSLKDSPSARYLEQPISHRGNESLSVVERAIPLAGRFGLKSLERLNSRDIVYHIRVHHVEHSGFAQLSCLALLLQRLELLFQNQFRKRLSVFIVPETGMRYPFAAENGEVDVETYKKVSRFLRLLAKEWQGVIYGLWEEKGEAKVSALDFTIIPLSEDDLPLIPVNKSLYHELFHVHLTSAQLDELFQLQGGWRYGKANSQRPEEYNEALIDYVIESAFLRLKRTLAGLEGAAKVKSLVKKTFSGQYPSPLQFAFFAFLLSPVLSADTAEEQLCRMLCLSEELCKGFEQIVQNAVQHSAHEKCFFTFTRLESEGEPVLEVSVADLNEWCTIADTFVMNLERERKEAQLQKMPQLTQGYENLMQLLRDGPAAMSHIFHDFSSADNDVIRKWYEFRQADSSAHIGLLLFDQTMRHCHAEVKVISSKWPVAAQEAFYAQSYAGGSARGIPLERQWVIPGTQFKVRIPILGEQDLQSLSLAQLSSHQSFREDYEVFASFLDYEALALPCGEMFRVALDDTSVLDTAVSKDKYLAQLRWTQFWMDVLFCITEGQERHCVYFMDGRDLKLEDTLCVSGRNDAEVFIKGLLNAAALGNREQTIFLAIINLQDTLLRQLREILFVRAVQLRFPNTLQLYFCGDSPLKHLTLLGSTMKQALDNAAVLSLEHGAGILPWEDRTTIANIFKAFEGIERQSGNPHGENLFAAPFDGLLHNPLDGAGSLFDRRIELISNELMDQENIGYRLYPTHMRLGSKVHIQSFYEMAFLFYRTSVANRIAFEILCALLRQEPTLMEGGGPVMFYGYASYSKAILTSLTEIAKAYLIRQGSGEEEAERRISFASYQYNLHMEATHYSLDSPEHIQLYFGVSPQLGTITPDGKLELSDLEMPLQVVQVVPISSTMTTFEKMWKHFRDRVTGKPVLRSNYTVYWVCDEENKNTEHPGPSGIEQNYWECIDLAARKVTTQLNLPAKDVFFFMRSQATWRDPLKCERCFPEKLLDEIPLVETDASSTVPAQQIKSRQSRRRQTFPRRESETLYRHENERLLLLRGCVYYGHIERNKCHHQFYIDTQQFFSQARKDVRKWLEKMRTKDSALFDSSFPVLRIIFSPEHNTNVGFAQYVNTYYFRGTAEIISINEDKEFRSNFVCEHAALIRIIRTLFEKAGPEERPVEFYFSDDNIISGETFHRASNLLQSLLPPEKRSLYPLSLFHKCFFLMERISIASKGAYVVNPEKNFLSYLHINISNMRHQGDSCVVCKLVAESRLLVKRSATKSVEAFWLQKHREHMPALFDDGTRLQKFKENQAFERLVLSHVAKSTIHSPDNYSEEGGSYDAILLLFSKITGERLIGESASHELKISAGPTIAPDRPSPFYYDKVIEEFTQADNPSEQNKKRLECCRLLIKLLSRPFFSYEFKFRAQTMTFLLVLAESFLAGDDAARLGEKFGDDQKRFLRKYNRIAHTLTLKNKLSEYLGDSPKTLLQFLRECILAPLLDLKSTYPLRRATMRGVLLFTLSLDGVDQDLKQFWQGYAAMIHRAINCSSDETRALWMEHLLVSGREYREEEEIQPKFLYEEIIHSLPEQSLSAEKLKYFINFCHEIFLQNTRLFCDCIEKSGADTSGQAEEEEDYFLLRWMDACRYDRAWMPEGAWSVEGQPLKKPLQEEIDLFNFLKKENSGNEIVSEIKARYDGLLDNIFRLICKKYRVDAACLRVALLTRRAQELELQGIEIPYYKYQEDDGMDRQQLKSRIKEHLRKEANGDLEELGYRCGTDGETTYMFLFFSNEKDYPEDGSYFNRVLKKIEPVYLYVGIDRLEEPVRAFAPWMIMRDLLCYRGPLMRMFEDNFNSDVVREYAHTLGDKAILQLAKRIKHSDAVDDGLSFEALEKGELPSSFKGLKTRGEIAQWLVLYNYVNGQIAKLFHRSFGDPEEHNDKVPKLYPADGADALRTFGDLRLRKGDRQQMLERAVTLYGMEDLKADQGAVFVSEEYHGSPRFYNAEYFTCLILDVILSSIKNGNYGGDYLSRIDTLLQYKEEEWNLPENRNKQCHIFFYRRENRLVIVNVIGYNISNKDLKDRNAAFRQKIDDPLSGDPGQMSMLTLARYVEGIAMKDGAPKLRAEFRYVAYDDLGADIKAKIDAINFKEPGDKSLVFMTELPVFSEGQKGNL